MSTAPNRGLAVGLIIVAEASYEVSAALAIRLFPQAGPLGMVTLRIAFAAIVLMAVARPGLRGHSRARWGWIIGFGAALATMNSLFYLSLDRIALGASVTIEALGPLVLSIVLARRWLAVFWAGLGLAGVALLERGGIGHLDAGGVFLAVGAGAAWAAYIVCSRRVGQMVEGLGGLALAMSIGALAVAPFGIAATGTALFAPHLLALGLVVAIGSSALPYALELIALRHIPAAAFSILMTLAPATAALSGLVFLDQHLAWPQLVGMAAVIAASIGATRAATK